LIVNEARDRAPPCPIENTVPRKIPDESLSPHAKSAGKKFGEARDRGGIFGDTGRFRATETALAGASGGKAAESQRLFRPCQETGIARDCVVGLVGMRYAFYFNALDRQPAPFRPIERKRELDRVANWIPPMDLRTPAGH
jgi:hypothetical protein